jgi:hypothetical protein
MSLKESIVKAKFIKTSKHIDNKWHVSVLNNKSIELLVEMGVNIEEDLIALNKGNY